MFYKGLVLFFFTFLLHSCVSDNVPNTEAKGEKRAIIKVDKTDVFTSDEYEFVLPQPFALAANYQEAGLTYDEERMNPIGSVTKYKTKGKQILNFGVYSTDLVYSILNERPQTSMEYFQVLEKLAEFMGMSSIFASDSLKNKIELNIANRDVLENLLIDLHERSQEYLEDNDLRRLAAIQFSGAWVEAIYLASFDFNDEITPIICAKIDDQMSLLDNAIFALESFEKDDDDLNLVLDELVALQETYAAFRTVINPLDGIPQLSGEEMQMLKDKIQSIRKLIVN